MSEVAPGKRRMPLRNRLLLILGIPALLAVVLAIAIPKVDTSVKIGEVCRTCGTTRQTTFSGIGLARKEETVEPSPTLDEVYGGTHEHTWWGTGGSKYFFGMRTGIYCGDPLPNPMALAYNRDPPFRDALKGRLATGSLKRDDLIAYLEVPDLQRRYPPGLDVKSPEFRDRLRRAHALVKEIGTPATMGFAFSGWEAALK